MKRKRRSRRPARHEAVAARAPGKRDDAAVTAVAARTDDGVVERNEWATDRARAVGCSGVLAVLLLSVLAICWVVAGVMRVRTSTNSWPSPESVGLSRGWAAMAGGLLVASAVTIWFAGRAHSSGSRTAARVALLLTALFGTAVLACGGREYRAAYQCGVIPWNARQSIYPQADLEYLRGVKDRLKTLYRERDDWRTQTPERFNQLAEQQLDIVTSLQSNLVSWTEQEVGHWLDDPDLRWAAIDTLAYQIHPVAQDTARIRELLATERSTRERRRQWLIVLRDHCQSRLKRIAPAPASTTKDARSGAQPGQPTASNADATSTVVPEPDEPVGLDTRAKLQRVGGSDWSFAKAVLDDPPDAVLIGERLNQIEAALTSLDAREAFVRDENEPTADDRSVAGLNRRYPFLRLPICLASGRAWAASYLSVSAGYGVLLLCGVVILLRLALRRRCPGRNVRSEPAIWFWWGAVAGGLVSLAVLYMF